MIYCWHYKNAVFRKFMRGIGQKPQNTVEDRHELHETADKIRRMAIGHDQQTGIIGQQRSPAAALFLAPADEVVTIFEVKGG